MPGVDPPSLSSERQILRPRITELIARQFQSGSRLMLIEAQAGQGKTTAALQFLAHFNIHPAWCCLTSSDQEPLALLSRLFVTFADSVPGFRVPLLGKLLKRGNINPAQHCRVMKILLRALRTDGQQVGYIVIDDLHQLEALGPSARMLGHLAANRTAGVRLLLLSRHAISPALGISETDIPLSRLNNAALAFTRNEIAELYASNFQLTIERPNANRLFQVTEGWAMGLTLLAPSLAANDGSPGIPKQPPAILHCSQIHTYFRFRLIDEFPETERQALISLAVLDTMPASLARLLEPGLDLGQLVSCNLFIRQLNDETDCYAFQQLFHVTLRQLSEVALTANRRVEILRVAARWHGAQGNFETAIRYLLRCGNHIEADHLTHQFVLELAPLIHTVNLHDPLSEIPEDVLSTLPWLTYLRAHTSLNTNPPEALKHLQQIRKQFRQRQDETGELLATAQLLFFHMTVDSRYQLVPELLERAQTLFERHQGSISVSLRVQCAQYIAFAKAHTNQCTEGASKYSDHALRLAKQHRLEDATAFIASIRGNELGLCGDWARFTQAIEEAYPMQHSPRLSAFTRLMVLFMQANLLHHLGDFLNYRHKRAQMQAVLSENLFGRTLCAPFLVIYDADMALAEGRAEDARHILDMALENGNTAPHMRSQLLHYRACIAALESNTTRVRQDAAESLRLRAKTGHHYHTHLNHLLIGQAYTWIGDHKRAEGHLERVLAYAQHQNAELFVPLARFLQAQLRLRAGNMQDGLHALDQALGHMRRHNYRHFCGWEPGMMRQLLALAVANGVEAEYARGLAAERLDCGILGSGETIPLLEIRTFGGLRLTVTGHGMIKASDLTPTQRELLGLLITAPQGILGFDDIQLALWPEVSPVKVRARLDTTVARLRRTLTAILGDIPVTHYLPLEKKQLRLAYCRVDAWEFANHARKGLLHGRRREYWRAGKALRIAHHHWRGPFLSGVTCVERYRDALNNQYSDSMLAWIEALSVGGETREARQIAVEALGNMPNDQRLAVRLFDLHLKAGDPARASRVLRDYEATLRFDGYSDQELAGILDAFWNVSETAT